MDALNEYQAGNDFGKAQLKEERERKQGTRAAKAKVDTKKAFSTKSLLKTDKVKPVKKEEKKPEPKKPTSKTPPAKPKTPQAKTPPAKPKTPPAKPKADNKGSDRASKFLGGQSIKELQEWTKKEKTRRERNDFLGQARKHQQEDMDRLTAAERRRKKKLLEEAKKRGSTDWSSSKLAESRRKLGGK